VTERFSHSVRVYIEDTDAGNIVYYVNYLKFMERARTEFMRTLGYDKPAFLAGDRLLVVHSANTRYLRPALLDDTLQVSAEVSRLARSYVLFRQCVTRGDTLLCEADIKVACVRRRDMRPVALPDDVHAALANHQSTPTETSA
jgi:4-hydroxybenzoyl-CoA thioesterase